MKMTKNMPKGCLKVMADPSDLGHGKRLTIMRKEGQESLLLKYNIVCLYRITKQSSSKERAKTPGKFREQLYFDEHDEHAEFESLEGVDAKPQDFKTADNGPEAYEGAKDQHKELRYGCTQLFQLLG